MRYLAMGVLAAAVLATGSRVETSPAALAVDRAVQWLASVQGRDGGWGQDGGETSYVRAGERLESNGNDVANTAVATLALLRAGGTPTRGVSAAVERGVEFVVRQVEASPEQGLAVTSITGSQIQRKLGPYIDTFVTSMLLAEIDGNMASPAANDRVRRALEKVVRKIERHQQTDGSWNTSGGWAPILGTSMASQSLYRAQEKGARVNSKALARIDDYTRKSAAAKRATGVAGAASPAAAGVPLYQSAQELEQLSRTAADRATNASDIRAIVKELCNARFVAGYGLMGGEEFFSYLNISDSLRRAGGEDWRQWNTQVKARVVDMQSPGGYWAGHHCITGRVAVTSAAVLTLAADRDFKTNETADGRR